MIIRAIRRITDDTHHNAFTGACWFKGYLYIAYRQSDAHCGGAGRIIVFRSRDEGISWEHAAVVRGPGDTRDAHLYTDGKKLYAVGFCFAERKGTGWCKSGFASSVNGDNWTNWAPYQGTGKFVLWRPQFHADKHYCAAYTWRSNPAWGAVRWFESRDGRRWSDAREIHSGAEQPSECALEIRADGHATMLMRCDGGAFLPYLCTSEYPFKKWKKMKLSEITLVGPAVWTVGDDVYIGGRWCYEPESGAQCLTRDHGGDNRAQTAIFRMDGSRPVFQYALPSGPRLDHSYMGVARHPENPRRFALSFYSDAIAPACGADQWTHPDIYWADVLFLRKVEFLRDGFLVSRRISLPGGLEAAGCPDIKDATLAFKKLPARVKTDYSAFLGESDLVRLDDSIHGKQGIVYVLRDLPVENAQKIRVYLGYDGPVKVWWNGVEVFTGAGSNQAVKDQTSLLLKGRSDVNRLAIALDTNGGKANGIFARWESADRRKFTA